MVSEITKDTVVCIVGLGYVGFPLAEVFSKHFVVIGFDINEEKINKLASKDVGFELTLDPENIKRADFVIITVPTPVSKSKEPDLSFIKSAAGIVGKNLKKGAVVVLESTVYPGVTEDVLGPILAAKSGLVCGSGFKIGYSPERVNPGDKNHTIDKITKIVAGMDDETTDLLAELYGRITKTYKTGDIRIAEAAKVIENIQRDLNIALMNELSLIFYKMGLDTTDVLDAAATKWNFNRYSPGLVGGHCIPVDPYYLVYAAKKLGFNPQVILSGRSTNDFMPEHIVELTVKALNDVEKVIKGSKILIMGLTFKENVEDTRESPVRGIIEGLKVYKCDLYGYDPLLKEEEIDGFGINAVYNLEDIKVDCVIITVAHDVFKKLGFDEIKGFMDDKPILIDVRGLFKEQAEESDIVYRSL